MGWPLAGDRGEGNYLHLSSFSLRGPRWADLPGMSVGSTSPSYAPSPGIGTNLIAVAFNKSHLGTGNSCSCPCMDSPHSSSLKPYFPAEEAEALRGMWHAQCY